MGQSGRLGGRSGRRPASASRGRDVLTWVMIGAVLAGLSIIWLGSFARGGAGDATVPSPSTTASPAPTATSPAPTVEADGAPDAASAPAGSPAVRAELAGLTIALDPGHNGANAENPGIVTAQVPNGRGGMKSCNTTGTATLGGYPEHAFTWDVAIRTRDLLVARGATVLLTRESDDGVGPCVDVRGTFAQDHGADLIVSIHGDGNDDQSRRGFAALISSPALNDAQGAPSRGLALAVVGALDAAGFARGGSDVGSVDGVVERSDLAGLNFAARPAVMVELGQMRNADDAAVMSSPEGRQRYAEALTSGLIAWAAQR